jgi:glycosidase
MEFHVSRRARDRYQFDLSLFSLTGNVLFVNFHAARLFTQKMNQKRDLAAFPEQAIRAGQINAMGMIDEILHHVAGLYRQQVDPQVFSKALSSLDSQQGQASVDGALRIFADEFPPLAVYRRQTTIEDYLQGETDGRSNREVLLEELLLLWLTNANPAMSPYTELFDDTRLTTETSYRMLTTSLHDFFEAQPRFGPDNQNLVDMLRSPAIAVPHSLTGQLEYIRERWSSLLGRYLFRLLSSLDLIREEDRAIFPGGPGPIPIPRYAGTAMENEPQRFSQDRDWMPTLVLIAKNTYVWLEQLSRRFQRNIYRLDQIPDEELDRLARSGISGLWLIGLWERSDASVKIKRQMGAQDAVASAYSLMNYQIAADIGGEEAYHNLRERAWQRGIRLASDMVPNHMGIDSEWVINHPDWFVSLDHSPFPGYSFNGPDLSNDGRVGVFLEDHYYDRTDAAVVFKRVDQWGGGDRFVYHGNDGTSMPWNDTAQLDYLKTEVREAVIQTILHVARLFPVIRFDAAMTLAKKHYQRLWFPEPGTGGAIPSRSEYGLTREQFDALMPVEFWREVVDRVAQEAPDTLLLAEAFWLMEGYFVRTLGMHRVYNSAFMNMLRNEDNANYRSVMKNTLEFDPEILKRFVNFMNNPDERTAVDQFGKGDKYFGVCTLMATLPGLPMLGHGQIEGFTEKYGMEFRKPMLDEQPDEWLVRRHEQEIFPLLHRRYLFAGVDQFLLYDFFTPDGTVNEDVFAYSNGSGSERALVLYHNKYASTRGWVRTSAAFMSKDGRGLVQRSIGEGLNLHAEDGRYTIFRSHPSGLEYIRSSRELVEQGFYADLNAYQFQVFMDFREVMDNEWGQYRSLDAYLTGRGVPSIDEALRELVLQPIHQSFRALVNPQAVNSLVSARWQVSATAPDPRLLADIEQRYRTFLEGIRQTTGFGAGIPQLAETFHTELEILLELANLGERFPLPSGGRYAAAIEYLKTGLDDDLPRWLTLYGWTLVHQVGRLAGPNAFEEQSRAWIDEWRLGQILNETALGLGVAERYAGQIVAQVKILTSQQTWFNSVDKALTARSVLENWLQDADIQNYLGVNRYQGVLWFNQEAYETFLWWMYFLAILLISADPVKSAGERIEQIIACHTLIDRLIQAASLSEFQLVRLLDAVGEKAAPAAQPPAKKS